MVAVFHIKGILHKSMEAWKMEKKMAYSFFFFAQYFNTLPYTPLGPHVFLALIALKTFKMVSSEMSETELILRNDHVTVFR